MIPDEKFAILPPRNIRSNDSTATKTMPAKIIVVKSPKKKSQCRLSFLYFIFGFVFPPIWIIGALYTPPEKKYQSSKGRRIDLMWKRASRLAFSIFVFALLVLLVAILALNPGALGWRTSRSDQNSAQKFIPIAQPATSQNLNATNLFSTNT
ncbi:hypothetical protein BC941DRAFT_446576 [Chlamydoabsidia padenii]|nr:hypothetical protein BC941DRAFT_446576 [Chlamydoabsidia padenii]